MNIQRVVQEHAPSAPTMPLPPQLSPIQELESIIEAAPQNIDPFELELPTFRRQLIPPELQPREQPFLPLPRRSSSPLPQVDTTDTRPIWPGRPELIYKAYLAEKEAWLQANPTIRPSQYRQKRGLKTWPKLYCEDNRWLLPRDRINLQSETLIEGRPNWTIEEIQAWLDWGEKEQQEVDRLVEEELVQAGGFGQGRRQGRRELLDRIEAESRAEKEKYKFVY